MASKDKKQVKAVEPVELGELTFKPTALWLKKLQAVLTAHRHVKVVYLNNKGDYHFNAIEGFAPVSAEDIMKVEIPAEAAKESTPPVETAKPEMTF